MIKILNQFNHSFFYPRDLQLKFLADCPEVIPLLADWLYAEWSSYDSSLTIKSLSASFQQRLNKEKAPLTYTVFRNSHPIATVSLKENTAREFAHYPKTLWLGALHVLPQERNQQIGQTLFELAKATTNFLQFPTFYFYSSNFKNTHWYLKQGAQTIEDLIFKSHKIRIFKGY